MATVLKVTTQAGDVFTEPYDTASQLTLSHPEHGTKAWGEVIDVETVEVYEEIEQVHVVTKNDDDDEE